MFAVMSNNYSTITLTHEHVENALSKYLNWSRRARLNKQYSKKFQYKH